MKIPLSNLFTMNNQRIGCVSLPSVHQQIWVGEEGLGLCRLPLPRASDSDQISPEGNQGDPWLNRCSLPIRCPSLSSSCPFVLLVHWSQCWPDDPKGCCDKHELHTAVSPVSKPGNGGDSVKSVLTQAVHSGEAGFSCYPFTKPSLTSAFPHCATKDPTTL